MSAERLREHVLTVLREEYPHGATASELRVRMARSGRLYTLENVRAAVATLRRLRLVTFNPASGRLSASDPEELQRRAEQALNEPSEVDYWGR